MPMELDVNGHRSRIASVAELRQKLAPFASQQFREIWLSMDAGGPSLCALVNTNVGWLMYLRHDQGDSGFSSRNPMYNESDTLGGLVFDGRYGTQKHVPVITYRLSNGQEDDFPASWALPEPDIMRALEYFVQHEGRRSPFVRWHDDAVPEPWDGTQPMEKGEFTVVLRTVGGMKIEVIREVRSIARLGLKEAKDLVEAAPRSVIEGVSRNEAQKIKIILETQGRRSRSSVLPHWALADRLVPTAEMIAMRCPSRWRLWPSSTICGRVGCFWSTRMTGKYNPLRQMVARQ